MAVVGLLVSKLADTFPAGGLGSSTWPDGSILEYVALILAIDLKSWKGELLKVKAVW